MKVKPHSCVEQLIVSDLVVCGASYHARAALSYDMRPHKQTRSDTSSCSTDSCGFPILHTSHTGLWTHFYRQISLRRMHMYYQAVQSAKDIIRIEDIIGIKRV